MRIKKFLALLLIILSIFTIVACNGNVTASEPEKTADAPISSILREDIGSREALKNDLIQYAIYKDYERSQSQIKDDIVSYVDTFHGDSDNTSKAISESRDISLVLMDSYPVTEDESICLEVYDIIDSDSRCFIIIPTDKRIADFLYLSDNSSWEQAKELEIFQAMLESMLRYSQDVLDLFNSLELPVESTKKIELDSHYTENHHSEKLIDTVIWVQYGPFNDAIEYYYGPDLLVGCGAIALGTIMAHHKYPTNFIDIPNKANLAHLQGWGPLSSWNGVYDWTGIVNGSNSNHRAALLLDVADACNSVYGTEETATLLEGYVNCLTNFGYSFSFLSNGYSNPENIFKVVTSIEGNKPVLAAGHKNEAGHAFVLDGAQVTTTFRMRYTIDEDTFTANKLTESQTIYYHANLGWGYEFNGWFPPNAVSVQYQFPCDFVFVNITPNN